MNPRGYMRLADLPPCAWTDAKRDDMHRAGGLCVCARGRDYYHHPADAPPYEWLNVLCDGTRVKL